MSSSSLSGKFNIPFQFFYADRDRFILLYLQSAIPPPLIIHHLHYKDKKTSFHLRWPGPVLHHIAYNPPYLQEHKLPLTKIPM